VTDETRWFCPVCETWVDLDRDECPRGHSHPRIPVLSEFVRSETHLLTLTDRLGAKVRLWMQVQGYRMVSYVR